MSYRLQNQLYLNSPGVVGMRVVSSELCHESKFRAWKARENRLYYDDSELRKEEDSKNPLA